MKKGSKGLMVAGMVPYFLKADLAKAFQPRRQVIWVFPIILTILVLVRH